MAKIPSLDRPGPLLPWWMTAIVTGQATNARLPLSHLGALPRGAIDVSLANYLADTSATTDADPGAGNLRWNHAMQSSATEIYLSDTDGDAADQSGAWPDLAAGGHLYLYNPDDLDVWQWWAIASATDASGYLKLGVSLTDSAGSFGDDDPIVVTIQQPNPAVGDAEDVAYDNASSGLAATTVQGALDELAGGGGAGGASIGVQYLADTASTSDADPGAGNLRWNHATQSSATQLFLDDSTVDGASLTGFWSALDAGGFAYLQDAQDQDIWQIWEVTSVTDAAGYVKFGVALLAAGGVFADNRPMLVTLQQGPGGGGGLANWNEGVNTSAPNNGTTSAAYLEAVAAAANADAVYKAKGNGASLAQIPDNTSAGGNKRGLYATDWQKQRSSAAQVASGQGAFVGAGLNNTAASTATAVVAGQSNSASNSYAAVVAGAGNSASGAGSFIGGGSNNAASGADSCVPGGASNDADGQYSTALGFKAQCRGIQGSVARSSGGFNNVDGDGQSRAFTLYAWTTNATQTTATTDRGAAGAANQIVLPNNSAFVIKGTINARKNSTGDASAWEFTAYIKRGANAASTAMVVACTPTLVGQDAGAAAWAVSVDADTTNGALRVRVTGGASDSIKWGVDVHSCNEVVG